ncbi:MAG: phosphodiesterase YaeI [Candidatus Eisenbacteria bacterium]|uniref:Phosphodiesterase YaeI n=1 Tax=Eiseniibacteriota bacterium TaxID=2212470 RepID=A0A956N9T3_UNCEI|nr:phosphodiesterase YaeI [Candidatus Eisenbacteria bacterium]
MARSISRRHFLLGGTAALAAGGVGYGCGAEPRWLERTEVHLSLSRAWSGKARVLHLSDLHRSRFVSLSFLEEAIELGLDSSPDLVCLTGDFVTAADPTSLEGYVDLLRRLSDQAPTVAVLGNHDGGPWCASKGGDDSTDRVRALLEASGVDLLHNRERIVDVPGGRLRLVGVGDLWGEECLPAKAFLSDRVRTDPIREGLVPPSEGDEADEADEGDEVPTLLLAHNPDTKDVAWPFAWDAMLSGHTHGGQVVLPWIGPPFVPVEDRRFIAGLHSWRDRWIYTTRGVGNILGVRVNCRPEVTLLEVTGGKAAADA